jgi:hypothetical protein
MYEQPSIYDPDRYLLGEHWRYECRWSMEPEKRERGNDAVPSHVACITDGNAVLESRVKLGAHTRRQAIAGALLGAACTIAAFSA